MIVKTANDEEDILSGLNMMAWSIRERIMSTLLYYTPFCHGIFEHQNFVFSLKVPSTRQKDI